MAVEGKARTGWLIRMLVGSAVFLGFAGWCLYDGMVRYPAIEDNFQTFYSQLSNDERQGLFAQMEAPDLGGGVEKSIEGTDYALEVSREEGTPQIIFINLDEDNEYTVHRQSGTGDSGLYVKSEWDVRTQFLMFGICAVVGGLIAGRVVIAGKTRMVADDRGLQIGKKRFDYDAVREIDKRKWDRKSIARITYNKQDGGTGKVKIDDWIMDGGAEVLRAVEDHVGAEVVIREPKKPASESELESPHE